MVFQMKGEHDKALGWYQQALDGREKAIGKDHPATLWVVCNIGTVFHIKREYDKALECYQQALGSRKKTVGKDHCVALLFRDREEYGKALEWSQLMIGGTLLGRATMRKAS